MNQIVIYFDLLRHSLWHKFASGMRTNRMEHLASCLQFAYQQFLSSNSVSNLCLDLGWVITVDAGVLGSSSWLPSLCY